MVLGLSRLCCTGPSRATLEHEAREKGVPVKIAMVSMSANPLKRPGTLDSGSQNVHVASLAASLADRGHTVTVYTRRDVPLTSAYPPEHGRVGSASVEFLAAGPPKYLTRDDLLPHLGPFATQLAAAWREHIPEIVHAHSWLSGMASIMALRALSGTAKAPLSVPIVQTFHSFLTTEELRIDRVDRSPRERRWMEPFVATQAHRVIVTCPNDASHLIDAGVARERLRKVPCGVTLSDFAGDAREAGNQPHRIVTVGVLEPRKGVDNVIASLALLADRGMTDIELEVVGRGESARADDPEVRRLTQLASNLGVRDRVHFRGQVPRSTLARILRSSHIAVSTPWFEPTGIAPIEAMSCGVPVIVSSVGALTDIVTHDSTGIHVPPKNAEALANAIEGLLSQPEVRTRLGVAGRLRVEELYTWERVARLTEKIYLDLLDEAVDRATPSRTVIAM